MASVETGQAGDPKKSRKGYTPPKGRPTTHKTGRAPRTRLSPMMEWILAGIVFVIVLAAIFYLGRGLRSAGGGGGAAPVPAAVIQIDDTAIAV